MREILFRGKNHSGWHYGSLLDCSLKECNEAYIGIYINGEAPGLLGVEWVPVDPGTVGQYTGLKDKNGKRIFEGDVLREPPKDRWDEFNYASFEVFFHDLDSCPDYNIGFSMNRIHFKGNVCGSYIPPLKPKTVSKMQIIGNIHENPELLECEVER